jgi:hypothetical protein
VQIETMATAQLRCDMNTVRETWVSVASTTFSQTLCPRCHNWRLSHCCIKWTLMLMMLVAPSA